MSYTLTINGSDDLTKEGYDPKIITSISRKYMTMSHYEFDFNVKKEKVQIFIDNPDESVKTPFNLKLFKSESEPICSIRFLEFETYTDFEPIEELIQKEFALFVYPENSPRWDIGKWKPVKTKLKKVQEWEFCRVHINGWKFRRIYITFKNIKVFQDIDIFTTN